MAIRMSAAIMGGALVAVCTAVLVTSPFATVVVLGVGCLSLPLIVAKDRLLFWLCLFLAATPFDITKTFMAPERAIALTEAVGAPWGPVAPYIHLIDLALLPLLATWLLQRIRARESIWFPRVAYLPLAFLSLAAVTSLAAPQPYLAFLEWIKQCKYFAIFLFAADRLDLRKWGKLLLTALVLTTVMQGAVTITRYQLQYFDPVFGSALGHMTATELGEAEGTRRASDAASSLERGFGTFYHANVTAIHLELLLPFVLALVLGSSTWRWRSVYGAVFAIGAAGHYWTFSRAGVLAFGASIMTCLLIAAARGLLGRKALIPVMFAALAAPVVLSPWLIASMQSRPAESAFHADHVREAARMALLHPIFGVGLNNSSVVRPYLVRGGLVQGEHLLPLHSHHLLGLAETGIVGYTLYVSFFLVVALRALRGSASPNFYERTFSIGVAGALVAMCLHTITDYLGPEAFSAILWLYAGLIVGMGHPHEHASGSRSLQSGAKSMMDRRVSQVSVRPHDS